jgi:hypothetical protein
MNVRPFLPADAEAIELHPEQEYCRPYLTPEYFASLTGPAFTVFHGEHILIAGGLLRTADSDPMLWSLLSRHAHKDFLSIHRITMRFLSSERGPKLAAVDKQQFKNCRWMSLLGFRYEGTLPRFGPDLRDRYLFSRAY